MKILITGGTGCIGAATIHSLLTLDGASSIERLVVTSRSSDAKLLHLWQGPSLDERIELRAADLADVELLRSVVRETEPTHIIHLAALQSPACDADPRLGMQINVGGTLQLFEIVKADCPQLQRFVFASSAAVYGQRALYAEATVTESAQLAPPNLYGVWKVAGEQLARLFHKQSGVPTVCLRLNTTYGPGRDLGKTSAPTTAMKCVAQGAVGKKTIPYAMPYQGRENYHYVEDVGAHFAGVCCQPFAGFGRFNTKGQTIEVSDFLREIELMAADFGWSDYCDLSIAAAAEPNLFVCDLEDRLVDESFADLPRTPIAAGIQKTLRRFAALAASNRLTV